MVFVLPSDEICPKCRKSALHSTIESHPSRRDIAFHKLECANCGPMQTKVISLKPGKRSPEAAA
jgi:hypothetical protein